jgi:hypothetical protein
MAMSKKDCFEAALKMIQVTPDNYNKLSADMILHLCKIVDEAEQKLYSEPSVYDNLTAEQIKERMTF